MCKIMMFFMVCFQFFFKNVYFLNEVTEQDLFSLTNTEKPKETALPEQKEPVCTCTQKCAVGMVNTQCELCSVNLKKCIGADIENTLF